MKIIINSTPVALWYDIIHDAEASCATQLAEELESYLVFLLMRYFDKPEIAKQVIATEFLKGAQMPRAARHTILQGVGDKCLLLTGLFPKVADKRLVKVSYFVNLGQSAYVGISKKRNDLYHLLSHHFVALMDILQSIRCYSEQYPDLLPLQAYDLWNETGSQRALSVLKQYTQSAPLVNAVKDTHGFK